MSAEERSDAELLPSQCMCLRLCSNSKQLLARTSQSTAVTIPTGCPQARETTRDGFEAHLGTNHLAHFLLTLLLLPSLRRAAEQVRTGLGCTALVYARGSAAVHAVLLPKQPRPSTCPHSMLGSRRLAAPAVGSLSPALLLHLRQASHPRRVVRVSYFLQHLYHTAPLTDGPARACCARVLQDPLHGQHPPGRPEPGARLQLAGGIRAEQAGAGVEPSVTLALDAVRLAVAG